MIKELECVFCSPASSSSSSTKMFCDQRNQCSPCIYNQRCKSTYLCDHAYSVLKRICHKIIKNYNRKQCRESYTVFDGGNSFKFRQTLVEQKNVLNEYDQNPGRMHSENKKLHKVRVEHESKKIEDEFKRDQETKVRARWMYKEKDQLENPKTRNGLQGKKRGGDIGDYENETKKNSMWQKSKSTKEKDFYTKSHKSSGNDSAASEDRQRKPANKNSQQGIYKNEDGKSKKKKSNEYNDFDFNKEEPIKKDNIKSSQQGVYKNEDVLKISKKKKSHENNEFDLGKEEQTANKSVKKKNKSENAEVVDRSSLNRQGLGQKDSNNNGEAPKQNKEQKNNKNSVYAAIGKTKLIAKEENFKNSGVDGDKKKARKKGKMEAGANKETQVANGEGKKGIKIKDYNPSGSNIKKFDKLKNILETTERSDEKSWGPSRTIGSYNKKHLQGRKHYGRYVCPCDVLRVKLEERDLCRCIPRCIYANQISFYKPLISCTSYQCCLPWVQ